MEAQRMATKTDPIEDAARKAAQDLSEAVYAALEANREFIRVRAEVDRQVALVPGCTPRADGPAAAHEWEAQLVALARVIRAYPEVTPPLPRWSGRLARQGQDDEVRRTKLKRPRRRTPEQEAGLDKLNAGRTVPAPVSTFTQ
jgi:hypothetical protein